MTEDLPTLGYPTSPTSIFYFLNNLTYSPNKDLSSAIDMILALLKCPSMMEIYSFTSLYLVCSEMLSESSFSNSLSASLAEKKI